MDTEAKFDVAGECVGSLSVEHWSALAASVAGPSHRRKGKACDDAAAAHAQGRFIAAVVCDGAGSASHGADGAASISQFVSSQLVPRYLARMPGTNVRSVILQTLSDARVSLHDAALASDRELSHYAATVVGAILHGGKGVMFHIGDGAGIAFDAAGNVGAMTTSSEQEYSNETYFLTDETWSLHTRFCAISAADSLLLMTDGVTPFAFNGKLPKESFLGPVLKYFRSHPPQLAVQGLRRMLDRDDSQSQVGDDKTLLWAGLAPR